MLAVGYRKLSLTLLLALGSFVDPTLAAPPRKIADIVTVDDLTLEISAKLAELEPWLATDDAFAENKKRIAQAASMLVVAAQALVEHEQESDLKPHAADLRDAGIQIARAEKQAAAAVGYAAAQAALAKTSPKTATAEYDWAKLVRQRPIMEETETRMQQLQRALRRSKDPAAESRLAAVIALASLPTIADTHEVKDPAQLPEWDRLAQLMVDQMTETATAIRNKDSLAAQASFKAARNTCVECHRQFKKEN